MSQVRLKARVPTPRSPDPSRLTRGVDNGGATCKSLRPPSGSHRAHARRRRADWDWVTAQITTHDKSNILANKHPLAPSTHHRFRVPIPSARGQKQYTLYGIINLCTMQYFKCWLLPCAF